MPRPLARALIAPLLWLLLASPAPAQPDEAPLPGEPAALAFVAENHPELSALLGPLKAMKPDEYARAIRELSAVSRSLSDLKSRDPARHALALDLWKARSRVDLLAARLASAPASASTPDPAPLREAVAALLDAEIRQQRAERDAVEARLRKVEDNLKRLEARRDSTLEARVQQLLKRGEAARRQAAARARAQAKAAKPKDKDQPKTKPAETRTPGGPQS